MRKTHHNIVFLNPNPKKLKVVKNGIHIKDPNNYNYKVKCEEPLW